MSQQYVFAQLKGAYLNADGWNLSGDAKVANISGNNLSELLLCSNNRTRSGAAFYSQRLIFLYAISGRQNLISEYLMVLVQMV